MTIMVCLLTLGALLEVCLHIIKPLWPARRVIIIIAAALTAFASGGLVAWRPNVASILLAVVSLYRLFNDVRIVKERMHERYLRRVTRRTASILLGLQLMIAGVWIGWQRWPHHHAGHIAWAAVAATQLGVAAVLLISTARSMAKTRWPAKVKHFADNELPSLSVAIPARNETDDLEACLASILASNYPKLEVLVLDDCSQNKRTPEIIRGFAHDGVRFIQGELPSDTWLPKNQAYNQLAKQASGELILFCGVDVRFNPDSLRQIVSAMRDRNKQMMSIMPWRTPSARANFTLVQAMRYWWELVPPRRLFNRPAVMSSCWIIAREALQKAGGFAAVTRSIVPEAFFAKRLVAQDGYSFMRSSLGLGVQSVKNVREQRATAVRMRYPQMHRRPEWVLLLALAELMLLALPFVMAIGGFWWHIGLPAHILATFACLFLIISYEQVVIATRINTPLFGMIALPLMALSDIALLQYSMRQYEFSAVEWKGRNVCIPVMHVVPHLPKV